MQARSNRRIEQAGLIGCGRVMATVHYKTCDRCGKKIEYIGWTAKLRRILNHGIRLHVFKSLNGNPDGYSYSQYECELCPECTQKLEKFLMQED